MFYGVNNCFSCLCFIDGQAVYKKLNGSLSKCQKKISKILTTYNELADMAVPASASYPSRLTEDAVDTEATHNKATQQLTDLVARLQRSQEQQRMVQVEATNVLSYLNADISKAVQLIQELDIEQQTAKGGLLGCKWLLPAVKLGATNWFNKWVFQRASI